MCGVSAMTVQDRTKLLLEDFDRLLEYVGGRVVEVVLNNLSSKIAGVILGELYSFLKGKALGYLTGADGGYRVGGEPYISDVAFIPQARQPEPSAEAYYPKPPALP